MSRRFTFPPLLASLPIRWRLALVSFGLFAVLLTALGIIISTTEEKILLANQANILSQETSLAQSQLIVTKTAPTQSQIISFSSMRKEVAVSIVPIVKGFDQNQNMSVAVLTPEGEVLATNTGNTSISKYRALPAIPLTRSFLQQWLAEKSYKLANDDQGQRQLVILQQIIIWDKTVKTTPDNDIAGYKKGLLLLSIPTTTIDQAISITQLTLALGIFIVLCIAAALTLPLISVALRPLRELERVSSLIAMGTLSLRLAEPPTQDEIGRMARAFNSMVARLEATFARQKRFVADVSHELRTPLTGLGGSLEMLLIRADNGDEETRHHLLNGMYREVERMQRLVTELLALTRLDEGYMKPQIDTVPLAPLVTEVCEQVQELLCGQELSSQIPADLPALRADIGQLRRVLLNIVENALKFTPPTGCITIVASREGTEHIRLEIQDTGIGILPKDLPHVFDRFYRADPARTRLSQQIGGNGLGLSIAKDIVEAHRGKIAIRSTPGEGTIVTLWLLADAGDMLSKHSPTPKGN
ncbi:hypothetical protein KSD_74710 [Ktedonobacter sp. SOSP1-85]|uniref:sensor histidine kinase n=1 Tax=Ktedonobacter sp. SOSP1-85 TaxID=2778367 RepID=UPI0019160161|nr:HAMP domain-containing sensor histidine kinase [Ktedonobacter sp. SOSP1-85]GHO79700.1 hypothetical protein KSD_74710 [Ktedonobacter sp. SOSP1-85]